MIKKKSYSKYYRPVNNRLTPLQTRIVELITGNPMSADEIAAQLGLKADNVRAYLSKASRVKGIEIFSNREKIWTRREQVQ